MSEYPELDAIEARANAATEGPWSFRVRPVGHCCYVLSDVPEQSCRGGHPVHSTFVEPLGVQVHGPESVFCAQNRTEEPAGNAIFIAAARTDVPRLAKALRRALAWTPCDGPGQCDPDDLCDPCEMRYAVLSELSNGALEGDREGALGELRKKA